MTFLSSAVLYGLQLTLTAEGERSSLFICQATLQQPCFLAMHYSELGRTDEAFAALQKCSDLKEERMIWMKDEWRLVALRNDPRFREILQKMNLAN